MKRIFCLILCLAMLAAVTPVLAAGVSKVMCVTNCKEWVSLRESPDTTSKRLTKVYLGELVTNCSASYDDFIYCEIGGKSGYIPAKYLKMTEFSMEESFPGNQMVVNVSEWTSMWDEPNTSSKRLAKVPLGSIVTSCVTMPGGFIYCEYKSGKTTYTGYISKSYLKKANYSATTQSQKVVDNAPEAYEDLTMTVVNCEDWVSLREKASASSARLAKVPLGTEVEHCVRVSDTFVYCCYNGVYGYIQAQYLAGPDDGEPDIPDPMPVVPSPDPVVTSAFGSLPELPDYQTLLLAGQTLLAETYQGYTIVVQRAFNAYEGMLAVCYDMNQVPLWRVYSRSVSEIMDVIQLDAFVAGTLDDPQLIWYEHGVGITSYAYGPAVRERWFLPEAEIPNINDTVYLSADYDGTVYVAFSDELMRISTDGQLVWRAKCGDESIFWPVAIEIDQGGISVLYDNQFGKDNLYGEVRFSLDGSVLYTTTRQVQKEA